MDLLDMGKYKNQNKCCYWILAAVEILSRYVFAIPVYRKDTTNMTNAVSEILKQSKNRLGIYPSLVQFDDGKEFHKSQIPIRKT